ncbi:hypothetical protein PTQ27_09105 [Mannheimia sp. AT1]|uniref:Uncharacterized protein n=1 Tax=Mannheimia cairinae TaxID=3025936 RepID=A0ABT5MQZ8_9PAST|nr:hypothetical protein [Mannheimia cairinae]MDD0824614.1 hypothetical protein [Mannheimia cairinae]MDD0826457.1 hypothetical protein [Mannheimia cairinae]
MLKHIKYSLAAFLCLVVFSTISQCSDGEELVPESKCKPETCEFKVTERIKLGVSK